MSHTQNEDMEVGGELIEKKCSNGKQGVEGEIREENRGGND